MHSEPFPLPDPLRLLLIIDQSPFKEEIETALHARGFRTLLAHSAEARGPSVSAFQPHLAVLDLDRSERDHGSQAGASVPNDVPLPTIALTRRGDVATKVRAFNQGIDDVLTVPCSASELAARIQAIARRAYRPTRFTTPPLQIGDLHIDIVNNSTQVGNRDVVLSVRDQSLLYLMASQPGRVFSRDQLLDSIWGTDFAPESNVVDRHIRSLRERLGDDWRHPRYIATAFGRGYYFVSVTSSPPRPRPA